MLQTHKRIAPSRRSAQTSMLSVITARIVFASSVAVLVSGCVPGATGDFMSPPTISPSDVGQGIPKRERRTGGDISVSYAPNGAELLTFGGDIRIRQAAGFVAATTFGGGILVDSLASGGRFVAHGGNVELTLTSSSSPRDLHIRVLGGNVELDMPKESSARIEIRMEYGRDGLNTHRIDTAFPVKTGKPSDWRREAMRGFRYRQHVRASGVVGSGRDRITIEVEDGSVILRGA